MPNILTNIFAFPPDWVLLIEAVVVTLIIVAQLTVYYRNRRAMQKLKEAYPEIGALDIALTSRKSEAKTEEFAGEVSIVPAELSKIAILKKDERHTEVFRKVVEATNNYILKNKGSVRFEALEQIASRRIKSWEDGLESVLVLPLYIGLLGTFSGVIIGLIKIAISGVSDHSIQSFIGGVLIGMIASAFGLYLTVRSNGTFKQAKAKRDENEYNYLEFIRLNLVSPSGKSTSTDIKSLRYNLNAFHEEFVNYQRGLNLSLNETLQRFQDLRNIFQHLKEMESGLGSISRLMRDTHSLAEKQGNTVEESARKTKQFSQYFAQGIDKLSEKLRVVMANFDEKNTFIPEDPMSIQDNWHSMLGRLEETESATRQTAAQLDNLYAFLQKRMDTKRSSYFFNSLMFKTFTFLGILAFISVLGLAVFYFLTVLYPNYF